MTLTAVIYWIALPALSVVRWRFLGWREANLAHWRHIQTVERISAFHPNQPLPRGNLNGRVGWKAEIQTETLPACRRYLAINMVSAAQGYTEREALAAVAARSQVMFERAEALAVALARDLERCVPLGMRRTDHPICHLPPDPGWP